MALIYCETRVQEVIEPVFEKAGVRLLVKREDLNHPQVSGNKWWKLKYNLEAAKEKGYRTLLTFGGAYSNHIFATAAAAKESGLESIGIIRGEEALPLNPILSVAQKKGMLLQYVSRELYRHKSENEFIINLKKQFGEFYLIPEGGSNTLAVKGCAEFGKKILSEIDFSYLCLPVGTGGTLAGIIAGLGGTREVVGFPVLKGAEFLEGEISEKVLNYSGTAFQNWQLEYNYHFGGYGKRTRELEEFISNQKLRHSLPLDNVYTGKMMFGVHDLVVKGGFKKGSTVLVIHTGGVHE